MKKLSKKQLITEVKFYEHEFALMPLVFQQNYIFFPRHIDECNRILSGRMSSKDRDRVLCMLNSMQRMSMNYHGLSVLRGDFCIDYLKL